MSIEKISFKCSRKPIYIVNNDTLATSGLKISGIVNKHYVGDCEKLHTKLDDVYRYFEIRSPILKYDLLKVLAMNNSILDDVEQTLQKQHERWIKIKHTITVIGLMLISILSWFVSYKLYYDINIGILFIIFGVGLISTLFYLTLVGIRDNYYKLKKYDVARALYTYYVRHGGV